MKLQFPGRKTNKQTTQTKPALLRLLCVSEGCAQWKCGSDMGRNLTHWVQLVYSGRWKQRYLLVKFYTLADVKEVMSVEDQQGFKEVIWFTLRRVPCQGLFLRSNEDQTLVPSVLTSTCCLNPAPHALLLAFSLLYLDFLWIYNLQILLKIFLCLCFDAKEQERSKVMLQVVSQPWKDSWFN